MTTKKSFSDLALVEPLIKPLIESGYDSPTPIQVAAIPVLFQGRDLFGCAQTGTGKTAAFALPTLQTLAASYKRPNRREVRALVLTPTRELAVQVHQSFKTYGRYLPLKSAVIFGGVSEGPQIKALSDGVDVLVATPGRLIDLMERKYVSLRQIEHFVLDEADRMLDMGFIHAIKRIISQLPQKRHNMFFSATVAPAIEKLAASMLTNPVRISVTPISSTAELIDQKVMFVEKKKKKDLLRHVLKDPAMHRVIVFTRTKHGASHVSDMLEKNGVSSIAIHGNKSQNARQRALEDFRNGKRRVLVATDIAARGIDIDDISHVINFELPNVEEDYVHRIGRTARAGASGKAISFCDQEERAYLKRIEKLTGRTVHVIKDHPYHAGAQQEVQSKLPFRRDGRPHR